MGSAIGSRCIPLVLPKSEPDQGIGSGHRLVLSSLFEAQGIDLPGRTGQSSPPSGVVLVIPALIMSTKIEQFYDQQPWNHYDQTIHPISFKPSGWFEKLVEAYEDFVDSRRQALSESTHFLWISAEQRKTDPGLAAFARARRQRQPRAGPCWKRVLQLILQGMIDGLCDLDILLDPIFLHFPRPNEARVWYPGLSVRRTNIPKLITALSIDHATERWRN